MRILLLCLLAACNATSNDFQPDAVPADSISDAVCRPDTNQFGDGCKQIVDGRLFTECTTAACEVGVCAVQSIGAQPICLRYCNNGCPAGQHPAAADGDICVCLKKQRPVKYPVYRGD